MMLESWITITEPSPVSIPQMELLCHWTNDRSVQARQRTWTNVPFCPLGIGPTTILYKFVRESGRTQASVPLHWTDERPLLSILQKNLTVWRGEIS